MPDSKSYSMHVKSHLKLLTVAYLCDVPITDRNIYYKFYREVIRCLSSFQFNQNPKRIKKNPKPKQKYFSRLKTAERYRDFHFFMWRSICS